MKGFRLFPDSRYWERVGGGWVGGKRTMKEVKKKKKDKWCSQS